MNYQQKLFEVKLLLHSIKENKKRAEKLGLDTAQFHGIEGEAFACYIIWVLLNDRSYTPAPPKAKNIDGKGKAGTYSVKYWSPILNKINKESNKLSMNDELDFEWLLIITPDSVYRVPREKIVPPMGKGKGKLPVELRDKALDEGLLPYTAHKKEHVAITDSIRNLEILESNYKICENNFDFSI